MDDPALPEREHRDALAALARLNRMSDVVSGLWDEIADLIRGDVTRLGVLDVATGSGDVAIGLATRAARAIVDIELRLIDQSPRALLIAQDRARRAGVRVHVDQRDVVRDGLGVADRGIDVVMCSLFLHHLSEPSVVRVLAEMSRAARRLVLVNDLRRCRTGLVAAHLAGQLGTRSRVVRTDAVRSVEGAFTEDELSRLAAHAGMTGAVVRRVWPFRMQLVWRPR